jgi:hypothetical protein
MRKIAHHSPEIHLPLFIWAERQRTEQPVRLQGYRVTRNLEVLPIWHEVRS